MPSSDPRYPNTQLFCTFVALENLQETLQKIQESYKIPQERIFVLSDSQNPDQIFCTYNVIPDPEVFLEDTISIHRNQNTGTLYTINALNAVVRKLNGRVDPSFQVPWYQYEDTFLVTYNGVLKEIETKLEDVVQTTKISN